MHSEGGCWWAPETCLPRLRGHETKWHLAVLAPGLATGLSVGLQDTHIQPHDPALALKSGAKAHKTRQKEPGQSHLPIWKIWTAVPSLSLQPSSTILSTSYPHGSVGIRMGFIYLFWKKSQDIFNTETLTEKGRIWAGMMRGLYFFLWLPVGLKFSHFMPALFYL